MSRTNSGPAPRSELQRSLDLSPFDRRLVALLQVDGRASFVELARQLGQPEKRIRARVRELLDSKVIRITPVADPTVLGYRHVAMLGMRVTGIRPSDLARELIELPAVDYVIVTTGRFHVWAELFCRDLTELRTIVEDDVRSHQGVRDVEIFPYLRLRYQDDPSPLPLDQKRQISRLGDRPESVRVDEIDRRIAAELGGDARIALRHVADRLEISEAQVRRRLARLQKSGAMRVTALTNPFSLGFEAIAKLGIRVRAGHRVADVASALARVDEVSYGAICVGRFDILGEIACIDEAALDAVLDGKIRAIPGLERVEVFLYLALHSKPVVSSWLAGRDAPT